MLRSALLALFLTGHLLASSIAIASPAEAERSGGYLRWAYHIPDDPTSLASLRQRSGDLDYVGLHWASIGKDGSLEIKGSSEVIRLVRNLGAKAILSVYLGGTAADTAHAILSPEGARGAAIDALVLATAEYDGISIDFEGLNPEDRDPLTSFMAQLAARLRPAGKLVTMAISAKGTDTRTGWAGAHDYAGLAPHSDLFVLMTYGYRTARSTVPGSSAPISWMQTCLAFAVSQIPPAKILLGVPLYGYDWNTTTGPPARVVRHPEAIAIANQQGARVQLDPSQQSARFSYTRDGHTHEVWFEDRASVEAKLDLMVRYGVAGVGAWRLGHEDPQVWQGINALAAPPGSIGSGPGSGTVPGPGSGTVPAPGSGEGGKSWYFAEGSTAPPFDTWFLLQNPSPAPTTARLTFMLEGGRTVARDLVLGPTSRTSVFANQVLPETAFSTRIDAGQPIFIERAMYAGFDGHVVTGIPEPSRSWFFAEGATTSPFHTWLLLQNPGSAPTGARISYLREDGQVVSQWLALAPNSRTSIFANQLLPDAAFSMRVESDQPIVAERAMYRFPGNAATGVTGVPAPSRSWFFAAGLPTFRNMPVDSWLLLQNPGSSPATATITYFSTEGKVETTQRLLPPNSRQSIFASQQFSAPSFGIRVESTGEIIAERSVFMGTTPSLGNRPQGAYATQGAPQLGTVWALPEGSTAPPFSQRVSVLNPHGSPMSVRFEFMLESGQVILHQAEVAPTRGFDLPVEMVVGSAPVSTRVVANLPTVVERTMFWTRDGMTGAHNTVGIRLQ